VHEQSETPPAAAPEPTPTFRVEGPRARPVRESPLEPLRKFLRRHGRKLWWIHSAYALVLGSGVVAIAAKGFESARLLGASLICVWALLLIFFRLFADGVDGAGTKREKVGFYVITYAIKNLYQGMLFFLLPFYWKSTTLASANAWFVVALAIVAVLSTLDMVFDRFVMRHRWLASIFHGLILFGALNLFVPAVFPLTANVTSLVVSAAVATIGLLSLHLRVRELKSKLVWLQLGALVIVLPVLAYLARRLIPPVPMYLAHAAVGPIELPDGRLQMEVTTVHTSALPNLVAVTDIGVPAGPGSQFRHIWKRDGEPVRAGVNIGAQAAGRGVLRLRSRLVNVVDGQALAGGWTVDVETTDGQIVGHARFTVVE
jgi:hypothetical protein